MTAPPRMHGASHSPGGPDPIPGLSTGGGGGSAERKLLAFWAGSLPTIAGLTGLVMRIPYDDDGSAFTFTLARAFARVEQTIATDVTLRVESSPGGGVFTPTTVNSITIAAGGYQQENTGLTTSVTSGQLLRLVYVAVGTTPVVYQVELLGSE